MSWVQDLGNLITDCVTKVYALGRGFVEYQIACVSVAVALFSATTDFVNSLLSKLLTMLVRLNSTLSSSSQWSDAFASGINNFAGVWYPKINAFIPLDLMFGYIGVFLVLLIVAVVIRIIKSFVPTVA